MEKLIKRLKSCKKKAQKYKKLHIKWLAKEQDAARILQSAYYSDNNTRNVALKILREYGLDIEVAWAEVDEDEYNTKTS